MPKFIITAPDGQKYEVNSPQGATESDAISYVQNNLHAPKQAPNVTDDMSGYERTMAGIGKGMVDIGRGAGQMLGMVSDADIKRSREIDADLMNTTGGKVGNFIGQAAIAAPAMLIPGANTYAGAGITGSALGALQPVSKDESRLQNMALGAAGGVAGQGIGNRIAKILGGRPLAQANANIGKGRSASAANVKGSVNVNASGGGSSYGSVGDDVSAGLSAPKQDIFKEGQELGFKFTPGQASGSRSLSQMEAKLESQPMTSGTFNKIKNNNQTILNRIAAKSIGETSDTLDSATLANAQQRIGNVYKIVADDRIRPIDPDAFLNKLGAIENEFEGMAKISDNALVKKFISQAANGQASGKQLQDLASKMGKLAANEMVSPQGDRAMGMALFQVKEHVDDLLQQGLSGETAKTFGNARNQYRNIMLLTQRNGVVNPSSGDVAGNALAGLLQQKDKAGFLFNKNNSDLYKAARVSQAFRPLFGDSGTATRSMITSPTDFALTLPFNIATRSYASSPVVNASAGIANAMERGLVDPLKLRQLQQSLGLLGGLTGANSN